jgi:hypothetical protein
LGWIAGWTVASGLVIRTSPRLSGRRLLTEAVNAGNGCNGSPNLSSESGWT